MWVFTAPAAHMHKLFVLVLILFYFLMCCFISEAYCDSQYTEYITAFTGEFDYIVDYATLQFETFRMSD